MNKKQIIGIVLFIVLIALIVGIKAMKDHGIMEGNGTSKLNTVYVATGGGKEGFIQDENVVSIIEKEYGLNIIYDSWSNGKFITAPMVREFVNKGNTNISKDKLSINNEACSRYDAMFCSDQRFYDYYKLAPKNDEAERYSVKNGGLTLNTPIVIYSWAKVTDALIAENIVTEKDGVFYITDMNKLIDYILQEKKWSDIGLSELYGTVNVASTDPVTSSPGATYYGLLLSIMCESQVNDKSVQENLPKLKEFYVKSGYMNNTPADLFERYLKTGMGGEPMIVDYEKSLVEFANAHPSDFDQVKDQIRVLYPTPTIWNSHCIATFTENGDKFYKVFENQEIQQIAWEKYGFRTGITGGNYDVSSIGVGVPSAITSTVSSLKMDVYNQLIDYLGN